MIEYETHIVIYPVRIQNSKLSTIYLQISFISSLKQRVVLLLHDILEFHFIIRMQSCTCSALTELISFVLYFYNITFFANTYIFFQLQYHFGPSQHLHILIAVLFWSFTYTSTNM